MGLSKIGKFYWLDIRIKGKRIRRSLRTANKLEALDRFAIKKQELLDEYGADRIRFAAFCKQYLEWAWSSKPASAKREEQRLRKISDFFRKLDVIYLSDITVYHIEQLKAWLKKKHRSNSTINQYLQILRCLFYRAIDWEVYGGPNPLKKIRFLKVNSRIKPLSHGQVGRILTTAQDISTSPGSPVQKIFHDIVRLAVNTGMRKSEILNLRWKDVTEEGLIIKGKGDKMRIVPLNRTALGVIKGQPQKHEYVFDIPNREKQDLFKKTIKQIRKRTGIDFHFHLFRHYFTTSLIEKGVDFVTAAELLGHSKRMITTLIYSHTNKKRKREAVGLLD